jgi:hypothetical protein
LFAHFAEKGINFTFNFNAPVPTGFHADFALCVMLPLAEAAYAVMNQPGGPPQLPPASG